MKSSLAEDILIVFVILLVVAQEALQVLKVGLDVLAGGKCESFFHDLSNGLQVGEFLVDAAKGDEIVVLAALDDLAFL